MPTITPIQSTTRAYQRQFIAHTPGQSSHYDVPNAAVQTISGNQLAIALKASTLQFGSTHAPEALNADMLVKAIPTASEWQTAALIQANTPRPRSSQSAPTVQGNVVSFKVAPFVYQLYCVPGQGDPLLTATHVTPQNAPLSQPQVVTLSGAQRLALNTAINTIGRPVLASQMSTTAAHHMANNTSWRFTQDGQQAGHEALSFRAENNQFTLVRQTNPIADLTNPQLPFTPTPYELRHTKHTSGESIRIPLTAAEYSSISQQWRAQAVPVLTKAHRLPDTLDVRPHLAELVKLVWNDSPFVNLEQHDARPNEVCFNVLPVQPKQPLVMNLDILPNITGNPDSTTAGRAFFLNTEPGQAQTFIMLAPPYSKLQSRLDRDETEVELGRLLQDVAMYKLAKHDHGLRHLVARCLVESDAEARKDPATQADHETMFRDTFPGIPFQPNPLEQRAQAELLAERIAGLIPTVLKQ